MRAAVFNEPHSISVADDIAEAYAAMDERRAIKSLVRVGTV
jgi:hypothetical protein